MEEYGDNWPEKPVSYPSLLHPIQDFDTYRYLNPERHASMGLRRGYPKKQHR